MDPSLLFRSPLLSDAENNNLMAAAAAEKARAMMLMTAGMRPHKTIPVKSLNTSGRLHVTKLASGVIHVIDKVPLAK